MDYFILPVLGLVVTPILAHKMSLEEFGIWILANTFLGFTSVFTFGLADATIRFVSKYRAHGDELGIVRVIRSTLTLYLFLGLIVGGAGLILAPLLVSNVFGIAPDRQDIAGSTLQIAAIGITFRSIDNVLVGVFHGYERYDLAARISIPINTLTLGLVGIMGFVGYGPFELVLVVVGLILLGSIIKTVVLKMMLCYSLSLVPLIEVFSIREIGSFGILSWIQGLSGTLLSQFDKVLIASILGTTGLAYYSVSLQLAQQVHMFLARATAFVFPLASSSMERSDLAKMRKVYFGSSGFVNAVAVALALPLFLFPGDILRLWINENYAANASDVLQLLSFAMALVATSVIPFYYLNGTGFIRLNTYLGVSSGITVALTSVLLIPGFGLVGAAFARFSSLPIQIVSRSILHSRILKDSRWYSPIVVFAPVISCFLVFWLIMRMMPPLNFGPALLVVAIVVSSLAGSILAIGLTRAFRSNSIPQESQT